MARLTKPYGGKAVHCNIETSCDGLCGGCKRNGEIRRKLRDYEDAEDKGLMIRQEGKWLYKSKHYEQNEYTCSICGQVLIARPEEKKVNFCMNCGAKMGGE